MERLFTTLTHAVEGAPAFAMAAALLWGILSILLSPCHLASIPLIVGFVNGQGRMSTRRALGLSSLFAGGILVSIAAIGAATAAAGGILGQIPPWVNYLLAAVFVGVGLHLLDVIPLPWSGPGQVNVQRKGPFAALLLGLIFGAALGPCTFAYMAPMLLVTFRVSATNLPYGVLLLGLFALGHCGVIVAAGASTEIVQRTLAWNARSKGAAVLKKACGVLVVLGGIYLLWKT